MLDRRVIGIITALCSWNLLSQDLKATLPDWDVSEVAVDSSRLYQSSLAPDADNSEPRLENRRPADQNSANSNKNKHNGIRVVSKKSSLPSNNSEPHLSHKTSALAPDSMAPQPDGRPPKKLNHLLFHNPKSGGEYAFAMISEILKGEFDRKNVTIAEKFRACNQATQQLHLFESTYSYEQRGVKCTMWMAEVPYSTRPIYKYTILRDPRAHVLSQYFHCREAINRPQQIKELTPKTLDKWLENWAGILQSSLSPKLQQYDPTTHTDIETQRARRNQCYNPTNLQSFLAKFDVTKQTKEDLANRYTVLGDTAQMSKTVCMILIRYTGSVPKVCDCSQSNFTSHTSSARGRRHSRKLQRKKQKYAHGVQHHGATYQTTPLQDELISNLTKYDQILYDWGRQVFAEQVRQVEEEYNTKICDAFQ